MNKYLKVFGILSILCFSFFYTEKIAKFMQSKDPLYVSIEALKDDYIVESVNATITDNYIIPGLVGKEVDVDKSFRNMQHYGYFVESSLVYNEVVPSVSLSGNEDKIIRKGNSLKNAISLIVSDENLITYLEEMGIVYNVLITKENMNYEYTHGTKINHDFEHYDEVEKHLKNKNINHSLCLITGGYQDFCVKRKKTLIEESLSINRSNLASTYKNISSGDIIYLQDGLEVSNLKFLLNQIHFNGLNIVDLTDLISESR